MVKVAKYVGLDVHKDTIAVASCTGGPMQPARDEGTVPHDLTRLLRKLASLAPLEHLHVVYEAGPTGFGLCRALRDHGVACIVVAPNRVPQMPGPRIKTDKRDARWLAWQLRMGSLNGIAIPDEELEALRDLVRAREDSIYTRRRTRQQLSGLLLRHDVKWTGKHTWGPRHVEWIKSLRLSSEAQELAKKHYLEVVHHLDERIEELSSDIERISTALPGVHGTLYRALQALRGVSTIVAATFVCELGDLRRFKSAGRLMSYVGMVPREYSSGPKTWRGSITKTGNPHVRRVAVEASWSGRLRPARPVRLQRRQEGLDQAVIDIAWKAQKRLYERYRRMRARGKEQNVTIIAMARELLGFAWAIGQRVEPQVT
jgi:transposase